MTRLILTLALLASPLAAFAQQRGCDREEAMSCAEGTTYDAESRTCVPVVG